MEPRKRTVLSTLAGVFLLLLTPVAALPAGAEIQMASAHSHGISHMDLVILSVLGAAWALVAAIMLLVKSTTAKAMIVPGALGLLCVAVAIVTNIGTILTTNSRADRAEHAMIVVMTLLPGIAGLGHVFEATGVPAAKAAYVGSIVVPPVVFGLLVLSAMH